MDFDKFVDQVGAKKIRPGAPCSICQSPNVEVLNEAMRRYVERKNLPVDDPEHLSMTRTEFIRLYISTQFPDLRNKDPRSFQRHAKNCLGIDL